MAITNQLLTQNLRWKIDLIVWKKPLIRNSLRTRQQTF